MAVAFVSGTSGGVSGAGVLTIAHTVSAGSNLALAVLVQSITADKLSGTGAAEWDGTDMGAPVLSYWSGFNAAVYGWVLTAPAVGAFDVDIFFNASDAFANATVYSFTGVHQTTPVSATAGFDNGFASSPRTLSLTAPTDGAIIDQLYLANASTTMTPTGTGHTAVGSKMVNSGVWSLYGAYQLGAASSVDWTFTGGTIAAAHGGIALAPSGGGGGGTFIPIVGRGPGLALAGKGGLVGKSRRIFDMGRRMNRTPSGIFYPVSTFREGDKHVPR